MRIRAKIGTNNTKQILKDKYRKKQQETLIPKKLKQNSKPMKVIPKKNS